jgi:peptidoglycan/LPS O-acetylase OafA/YrhL
MSGLIHYPRRNLAVDLLRGISILVVMLLHARVGGAEYSPPVIIPSRILNPVAYNGALGVCMFFVISGYLITSLTLQRDGGFCRVHVGRFYIFRASRILPPVLLLIAVNLACNGLGLDGFGVGGVGLGRVLGYLFTFRFNLLYVNGADMLPAWAVLWSLSIEEMFYFLFPLVSRLIRFDWLMILALVAVVLQGPFYRSAHGWVSLYSYCGCFDQLALGCLVALASRRFQAAFWNPILRRGLQTFGLALFATLCYSFDIHAGANCVFLPSAVALAAGIFLLGSPLAAAKGGSTGRRWPNLAWPLCLAGFLSYELYLFYAPIMLLLRQPLHRFVVATGGIMPRDVTVAVLIGFATILCGLLHTWIHEPILRWGRDWRRNRSKPCNAKPVLGGS